MKRETGESPVRTRHRNYFGFAIMSLRNREGGKTSVSVGRPAGRCTKKRMKRVFKPRVTGRTKQKRMDKHSVFLMQSKPLSCSGKGLF